jgi:membrane protease YdiL (CAAX protease family)
VTTDGGGGESKLAKFRQALSKVKSKEFKRPIVQFPILLGVYLLDQALFTKIKNGRLPLLSLQNLFGSLSLALATFAPKSARERATGGGVPGDLIRNSLKKVKLWKLLASCPLLYLSNRLTGPIGDLIYRGLLVFQRLTGMPITEAQDLSISIFVFYMPYVLMSMKTLGFLLDPFFPTPFGKADKDKAAIRLELEDHWLGWVIGGYYSSALMSNILTTSARKLYDIIAPRADLPPADTVELESHSGDQVISELAASQDVPSIFLGWLSAGFIAPYFEEVLYRAWLMPLLMRFLPSRVAMPLHAIIFGGVHQAVSTLLSLSLLGGVWGKLYVASGNLIVPVLVHAMWNSRSFVNSLMAKFRRKGRKRRVKPTQAPTQAPTDEDEALDVDPTGTDYEEIN